MAKGLEGLMFQIVFLAAGMLSSLLVYVVVANHSGNTFLGFLAMAVAMAFWIGTLTVVISIGKGHRH